MPGNTVSIDVTVNNQTGPGITSVQASINGLGQSARDSGKSLGDMKAALISLAPAAVPVAAALVPIVTQAGAATVALAAFGAAAAKQVSSLADAAKAEKKYQDAIAIHGKFSKQAQTAEQEYQTSLAKMPAATKQASAGFSVLSDSYAKWSDSLAKDTMPQFTKSFAIATALLPKFTPLVKGAAGQVDRLTTALGGAVAGPGFDALSRKASDFANNSLKKAVDGTIHLSRVLSEGNANGPLQEFFAYAKANGPAVRETLEHLGQAVTNVLKAASEAGPGLLSLVNAFAKLVAAVPASLLANLMQVYTAFKLIKLAGVGVGAAAGGVTTLTARIVALRAASVAAGGGVAGLRAAFATLGTATKATVVVAGIAALALVLSKLASIGEKAPPDIDRMTTSIAKLGDTGKLSGEALRVLGTDMGSLSDAIGILDKPSVYESVDRFLTGLIGMESTPDQGASAVVDSLDESLANLVKGGKASLAKAALDDITAGMAKQGRSADEVTGHLDNYKSALADAALEAKLTAQSMGLFGTQAQDVQQKLDAQKASADGLRQAIQALNDVNRAGLDGMIGFEAAIDAASKAAKDNGRALNMVHGQLDLGSEKARTEASALDDLAAKTDAAAASARDNGASWSSVNKIYDRGRAKLISTAQAMGLTKAEAQKLASQILKTPDKTAKLKGNLEDLQTKLDKAKAQLKTVPDSRKAKVQANISQLKAQVAAAKRAIASVTGKTVNLIVKTSTTTGSVAHEGGGYAHGGIVGAYANGGTTSGRLSLVGEQGPELVRLPVGSTVYPAGQSQRMMDDGAEPVRAYAKGGKVTAAEKSARSAAMGSFGMSYFARMAGAQHTSFESSVGSPGSLGDLVSTLNQWRASIKAATSGGVERSLLAGLTRAGKGLIAHEKALTKVNAALSSAKDKLTSLKDAAAQLRDSVASGIVSGANITGTAQGTGLTSTGRILDQLTQDRDKASSLAGALKTLKGRGLNSQSLSEIASAGVQGGGLATAEALMSASGGDIQQINQLEKQLKLSAASAGKTTADSMYGAGIKAADGLVKGLEKQQHRLDAVMAKAAKALEKAIEKAFKGKATGGIVGAATGGARGGLTWVGEQGPELARLPYGSTVYPAGQSRQMAGGGGSAPMVIQLNIGSRDFGQLWIDTGKREIKTRGGNVTAVLSS